jgi:hypothetical protein
MLLPIERMTDEIQRANFVWPSDPFLDSSLSKEEDTSDI